MSYSLTINGSGYYAATTVTLGDIPLFITSRTATQLVVTVPSSVAGTYLLVVSNPAPGGGSASRNYTINNPVPFISNVTPSSVTAGTPLSFTINGGQFAGNATVTLNGVSLTVNFVSNTRLDVTGATFTTAGTYLLVVANPGPGGGSASTTFTIAPGPLASLVVSPDAVILPADGTQAFTALARDAYGNVITGGSVSWAMANPGAGAINATGPYTATFQATTTPGSYPGAVRAFSGTIQAFASITVVPGPLARIELNPPSPSLSVGQQQSFSATGYDAFNNVVSGLTFDWQAKPAAGTLLASGPTTATFRAGTTPGTYFDGVTATADGITGGADIIVRTGSVASVVVEPPSATLRVNESQLFTASVRDAFGNPIPGLGVTWQAPEGGMLTSTGILTAVLQAGNVAGTYDTAIIASNGAVSQRVRVTVLPGAPAAIQMRADPTTIPLDGSRFSTIVITVTDRFGNPIGTNAPVNLTVDGCLGTCTLDPPSGNTDSRGVFTALLRGTYSSPTQTATANMTVTVSTPSTNGTLQRSVTVVGVFSPFKRFAPLVSNGLPDNHTACTAWVLTPPASVSQPPNNPFNIYRITARRSSYNLSLVNFTTQGQVLLYRVTNDRCRTNNTMSVSFVGAIPITGASLQTTLTNLISGNDYLIAVNITGAASNRPYTLTIQP
ncbi:MAG: Ig-like domain-containing protein [Anaerolineae bacterium]|nr:Ig-like domain-containing protein [Anaerolineae bacterium]